MVSTGRSRRFVCLVVVVAAALCGEGVAFGVAIDALAGERALLPAVDPAALSALVSQGTTPPLRPEVPAAVAAVPAVGVAPGPGLVEAVDEGIQAGIQPMVMSQRHRNDTALTQTVSSSHTAITCRQSSTAALTSSTIGSCITWIRK